MGEAPSTTCFHRYYGCQDLSSLFRMVRSCWNRYTSVVTLDPSRLRVWLLWFNCFSCCVCLWTRMDQRLHLCDSSENCIVECWKCWFCHFFSIWSPTEAASFQVKWSWKVQKEAYEIPSPLLCCEPFLEYTCCCCNLSWAWQSHNIRRILNMTMPCRSWISNLCLTRIRAMTW